MEVVMAEGREHYDEINALVAAIAKALGLPDEQVAAEIEAGAIVLTLGEDDNANRCITVQRGDVCAQVYQGAIRHASPDTPPDAG
jgi:hypothetical protein